MVLVRARVFVGLSLSLEMVIPIRLQPVRNLLFAGTIQEQIPRCARNDTVS
jgi:hypothetical protein